MLALSTTIIGLLLCFPSRALAQWGYTLQNGQVRLLGSSFGIAGANSTFDYVIVGGGTAGLTLAKRLAEDPQNSVAVVEAGSFYELTNGNHSQIPAYDTYVTSPNPTAIQPQVDWGLISLPQRQLNNREIHYAQGKCFGGGSARNYLVYQRGTNQSYQIWANLTQDQSFQCDQLLPFFQKSPQFTPPNYSKRGGPTVPYDPNAFSSDDGPLQLGYTNYYEPFSDAIKSGFSQLGLAEIPGLNSGSLPGFAEFTLSIDPSTATRSSSETSFLQAAMANSTLQVYQSALAKRILFNSDKTATGVEVSMSGAVSVLSARKEVIVSSGVFRSPQLLMVSGIGPEQALEALNVPVLSNLSGVGQNLHDHPQYSLSYRVNVPTNSRLTSNASFVIQAAEDFLNNQTGPLTTSTAGNTVGWEKLPQPWRSHLSPQSLSALSQFPPDWPELEILPLAQTTQPVNDSANYAAISMVLVAPTSRGNVTLNSTDTSFNPLVYPNWLGTTIDQEVAVGAFHRARQLANATGLVVGPEFFPGPVVQSDEQILEWIKGSVTTIHHAVGTCAMGAPGDPSAVVDTHGRVFGVWGLRVVDASIFPFLPPGHPQSGVYIIAEKIANDIKSGN